MKPGCCTILILLLPLLLVLLVQLLLLHKHLRGTYATRLGGQTRRACRVGIQVPHGVAADKAINYAHFVEVITSLLGFLETQSESDHVLHYCF